MNSEIKIEKGIPTPGNAKSFAAKYPWDKMEVGDSFLAPQADGELIHVTRDRANKAVQYARKRGWTFATRTVEGGIRIWRLS